MAAHGKAPPDPVMDDLVAQTIQRAENDVRHIESLPEEQQRVHAEDLRLARLHASLMKQAKERYDLVQDMLHPNGVPRLCGSLTPEETFEFSDSLADVLMLALHCDDRRKSFI